MTDKALKDIYENLPENEKTDVHLSILNFLTTILFEITQSLYDNDEKIKYHLREIEGKYFRYGLANHSIMRLIKENKFQMLGRDFSTPDLFSLNSLTRMQIESYLIMFYLFFDKEDDSEKDFRYDIYKIHALQKQLNFDIDTSTPNAKIQLKKIEIELNQANESLRKSTKFIEAKESRQNQYLFPRDSKLMKSKEIFEKSQLSAIGINQIWQLFSNHAHAEHISDRQFYAIYGESKNFSDELSFLIAINVILTSKLILELIELFDGAKRTFDSFPDEKKSLIIASSKLKNKS